MKRLAVVLAVVAVAAIAVVAVFLVRGTPPPVRVAWQRQVSPGDLSAAHAFLAQDCAACHVPAKGVQAAKCVACHVGNEELLALQPSAFHASVQTCQGCHVEHQGLETRPTRMDHAQLAQIGLRELGAARADREKRQVRDYLTAWMRTHDASAPAREAHPGLSAAEATLDCASCHSNKDPHFKLLGRDCASCHGTAQWTIAAFAHPSPRSTNCAQCHQSPPSHSMMHFEMMDKAIVARGTAGASGCCANVQVNQCYQCHQTDAWNSIRGVGWVKVH